MKKKNVIFFLSYIVLCFNSNINAQTGKVPPFRMVQSDGKVFKAENLPMEKPILIIYFSPECEECHALTKEILSNIKVLQKASIVMITYLPVETVKQYVTKNKLADYKNIFVGTEGNYLFVKDYYKIDQFPFMALYTKNGDLIKKYHSKEIYVDDLLFRLKSL